MPKGSVKSLSPYLIVFAIKKLYPESKC